jgi:DNA-binding transcriptional MerR regulator
MSGKNITEHEQQTPVVGKKLYYTIKEVCQMTGLGPHTLRNWESEFFQLRPKKNSSGNRAYRDKDIELILQIKHLLQDKKYTLASAKEIIREERREKRLGKQPAGQTEDMGAPTTTEPENLSTQPTQTAQVAPPAQPSVQPTSSTLPPDIISNIHAELEGILRLLESR